MNKHTPGPWHIQQGDDGEMLIKPIPGQVVAVVEPQADKEEEAANARLIAAAPELLEALMSILEYAPQMELCMASRYGGESFTYVNFRGYIADAEAAISKATGS